MSDGSLEGLNYFAEIAASYDRVQPVLSSPYAAGIKMIVDLIPFGSDDPFKFVDLGCGTAEPTARVLAHFRWSEGCCIDSEPEMLRIAKRKLTPYGDRIEVREADITRCALRSCDVVFSAKTFHHIHHDHLPALFARIAGALRPGGCFILFDTMSVGTWLDGGGAAAVDAIPRASRSACDRLRIGDAGGNRRPAGIQTNDEGGGERR